MIGDELSHRSLCGVAAAISYSNTTCRAGGRRTRPRPSWESPRDLAWDDGAEMRWCFSIAMDPYYADNKMMRLPRARGARPFRSLWWNQPTRVRVLDSALRGACGDFVNLKDLPAQSFGAAHRGRLRQLFATTFQSVGPKTGNILTRTRERIPTWAPLLDYGPAFLRPSKHGFKKVSGLSDFLGLRSDHQNLLVVTLFFGKFHRSSRADRAPAGVDPRTLAGGGPNGHATRRRIHSSPKPPRQALTLAPWRLGADARRRSALRRTHRPNGSHNKLASNTKTYDTLCAPKPRLTPSMAGARVARAMAKA
nr:unnamed protein product [Digitaria exilis]